MSLINKAKTVLCKLLCGNDIQEEKSYIQLECKFGHKKKSPDEIRTYIDVRQLYNELKHYMLDWDSIEGGSNSGTITIIYPVHNHGKIQEALNTGNYKSIEVVNKIELTHKELEELM